MQFMLLRLGLSNYIVGNDMPTEPVCILPCSLQRVHDECLPRAPQSTCPFCGCKHFDKILGWHPEHMFDPETLKTKLRTQDERGELYISGLLTKENKARRYDWDRVQVYGKPKADRNGIFADRKLLAHQKTLTSARLHQLRATKMLEAAFKRHDIEMGTFARLQQDQANNERRYAQQPTNVRHWISILLEAQLVRDNIMTEAGRASWPWLPKLFWHPDASSFRRAPRAGGAPFLLG